MDIENTKLPPNSIDSEQSVLGGLLLHNDSWDRVVNILGTNDFYQASHRIIYDAIVTLLEHDKPADILTVKDLTFNYFYLAGFLMTIIISYLTLLFLRFIVKSNKLYLFAIYTLILSLIIKFIFIS